MSPVILNGRELPAQAGSSLFDYADSLRVRVPTSCGRTGQCHECIVEIRRGMKFLDPPTPAESFLRGDYRLACQATVEDPCGDLEFAVLRRQPRILTERIRRPVALEPDVRRSGTDVMVGGAPAGPYQGRLLGLAGDIGTTTVVMNLADLETGEVICTSSFENPQRFGGSDIMHRISYDGGEYQGELRQVMLSAINFEIGEMARQLDIHRRWIYDVVFVGNTTMRDILFGLDVQPVGVKPYKSTVELEREAGSRGTTALRTTAQEFGLRVFPGAAVYSPPIIGCHVGADVAAGMLAVGMDEQEEPVMLVDVGTNTEVVVGNRHGMVAASCPAGPAFEGGQVTYGMPGYDGAVESVRIDDGFPVVSTIGGTAPQGICGSGLVDLLAELRRWELINDLGAFPSGQSGFVFAPVQNMALSGADISALAQAKSANYAGQYITLRSYGTPSGNVSRLFLAGGFANYVNVANAVAIGFIANFPEDRITKAGNAALEGATILLLSTEMRDRVESLVTKVEHIELETTPDFFDIFVEGCMFKPMPREVGP